ncbi:MAG: hypothetical protein JWL68_4182, partial [Actinomycetia bacterium]|nr:hypothetical protein [Actinomycetes bacterium]
MPSSQYAAGSPEFVGRAFGELADRPRTRLRWVPGPPSRLSCKIAFGPMVKHLDPLESTPPAFSEAAARQILRDRFGVDSS